MDTGGGGGELWIAHTMDHAALHITTRVGIEQAFNKALNKH